jgi:cobyrinic acid a,c-diamide synthase
VALERLTKLVIQRFDLDQLWRVATSAPPVSDAPTRELEPLQPGPRPRIGVAQDRAFGFYYQDTIDVLRDCGAEIVPFSPLDDAALPPNTDGVYLGGGFPELYAAELAANARMRSAIHEHAGHNRPIYAECGGLMVLGESLTTFEAVTLPMFNLLPVASRMQRRTLTIGYREVEAMRPSPLMAVGTRVRGHEFHWSVADPPPASIAAYRMADTDQLEGFCIGSTLASYVHLNFAGAPEVARHLVESCAAARL